MTYPAALPTKQVSFGSAVVLEGGAPLAMRVTITGSRSLVHRPSGSPLISVSTQFSSTGAGSGQVSLPICDSPNMGVGNGTTIALDSAHPVTHIYTALINYFTDDTFKSQIPGSARTVGPFALFSTSPDVSDVDDLLVGSPPPLSGDAIVTPSQYTAQGLQALGLPASEDALTASIGAAVSLATDAIRTLRTATPLPGVLGNGFKWNGFADIQDNVTTVGGNEYVVWVNGAKNPVAAMRPIAAATWVKTVDLSLIPSNPFVAPTLMDSHNSYAITRADDGRVFIAGNMHSQSLRMVSLPPGADFADPAAWVTMTIPSVSQYVTYPRWVRLLNGKLLFFYREGISGNGNLMMTRWTGTAFTTPVKIFDGQTTSVSPYWDRIAVSPVSGAIGISMCLRDTEYPNTNHDKYFMQSFDDGDTWMNSKFVAYTLPVTPATIEKIVPTAATESGMINTMGAVFDSTGRFHTCYFQRVGSDPDPSLRPIAIWHTWFDGANWQRELVHTSNQALNMTTNTVMFRISRVAMVASSTGEVYLIFRSDQYPGQVRAIDVTVPGVPREFVLAPTETMRFEPTIDSWAMLARNELKMLISPMQEESADPKYYSARGAVYKWPLTGLEAAAGGLEVPNTVKTLPTTRPVRTIAPPTNPVRTARTATSLDFAWTPSTSPEVVGYRIKRNGTVLNNGMTLSPNISATGLSASTSYTHTIEAYDIAGNISAPVSFTDSTIAAGQTFAQLMAAAPWAARYKMDDTTGTVLTDSSGNARNGAIVGSPTLGGPSLVPADSTDKSITFDGVDDVVTIPYGSWMVGQSLSIVAVIKTTTPNKSIVAHDDASSVKHWHLSLNGGGQVQAVSYSGGTGTAGLTAGAFNDGNPHLIEMVIDSTVPNMKLYVDGNLRTTTALSGTNSDAAAKPITIGARTPTSPATTGFVGGISEVAYAPGVVRSQAQVTELYAAWLTAPA